MNNPSISTHVTVMRRANHEARVAALREGRRQRAATFRAKKGKGSYRRTTKHRNTWAEG